MKNFASFIVFSVFMMCSNSLYAQEKKDAGISEMVQKILPEVPKNEKDIGAVLSPIKKSQLAPFTGVLISPFAIANLIAELRSKNDEIALEVEKAVNVSKANFGYEKEIFQNQCNADKQILKIELKGKVEQIEVFDKALKQEIDSRPNMMLTGILSVTAGVIFATATASIIVASQ